MFRPKLRFATLAKGAAIGCAGLVLGSFAERQYQLRKHLFSPIESKPGLPIYGTVSAATVLSPAKIPNTAEVVANTPARVTQIMKYGFPGFDNVRS